ncbi:hypothetical protein [Salinivibrio proteolyticus]|uniref:Uncharacterized protein n=1 Tax=Salinivibrio proteolyticus TaxID=334715 RepID=A0ABY7LCC4_9GAMM|nr:hypothetical protein [Salinivibrio proteolyticus]WBA13856.1 hypothetical protein N7E60_08950 [Salinivibrio proteolyticus]
MSLIYYIMVALFRWDLKWIFRLKAMWGITRLSLVIAMTLTLIIDGYYLYERANSIYLVSAQLDRQESCSRIIKEDPSYILDREAIKHDYDSFGAIKDLTDKLCRKARAARLSRAISEVLGAHKLPTDRGTISVRLPNGEVMEQIPENATKQQVKEIAIKAGLAKKTDFIGFYTEN